ncbi:Control of competence regulator ComK, YlbF/YmcA [Acididesulfobacillus acetoxydans]|uniref:Control of competence regulator ComK, YlbF/YmcA n=1 Tax=Acididesulfobacillus acetoxydans TaxID=1561005 RepID=A0A8S0WZF5_9FIRM|nr:YlbF family regulator [Acididesulfobacillus acetoxydans]CAA7601931.1 Control of competence regulator ComK, YlbF/YmcA [Acididesulfobacillus acetoxydans]CEJ08225.1 UPF0342 protein <locus_tag> [Acididesulfobacillus acetoxydans]
MLNIDAEIYDRAQSLAEAIGASLELRDLRETERIMLANEEAQKIIAEFQSMQHRLQERQEQGQEISEEDKKAVALIEETVENNPFISPYLQAQDRFTEMLDSVNSILAGAIASGDTEADDGCASCGTGGCSSCQGGC